jgi:hypothetical protein
MDVRKDVHEDGKKWEFSIYCEAFDTWNFQHNIHPFRRCSVLFSLKNKRLAV